MVVHRFPAPGWVNEIAVTADETRLLIACSDGSLAVWEIETGKRLWEQNPKQTGLGYVYDASFAHDGMSCIVCNHRDHALILRTATGEHIGVVRFPPMQTNIMSAALSPDGRSGVLIDLGERLHTFDLATGTPKDTGLTGAWPVRYSADGKHVAFRSNNSGTNAQVRVVQMDGSFTKRDVGAFSDIRHIRPTGDGSFLACGRLAGRYDKDAAVIGVRVHPGREESEELWRLTAENGVDVRTDFSPETMIGVSTDFRLVTRVIDLRTGASLQVVDNSVNNRPRGIWEWVRGSWLGRGAVIAVTHPALLASRAARTGQ